MRRSLKNPGRPTWSQRDHRIRAVIGTIGISSRGRSIGLSAAKPSDMCSGALHLQSIRSMRAAPPKDKRAPKEPAVPRRSAHSQRSDRQRRKWKPLPRDPAVLGRRRRKARVVLSPMRSPRIKKEDRNSSVFATSIICWMGRQYSRDTRSSGSPETSPLMARPMTMATVMLLIKNTQRNAQQARTTPAR